PSFSRCWAWILRILIGSSVAAGARWWQSSASDSSTAVRIKPRRQGCLARKVRPPKLASTRTPDLSANRPEYKGPPGSRQTDVWGCYKDFTFGDSGQQSKNPRGANRGLAGHSTLFLQYGRRERFAVRPAQQLVGFLVAGAGLGLGIE